jgi:hypothetical protein
MQFSTSITGCTFANNQAIGGDVISTLDGVVPPDGVAAGDGDGGAFYQEATNAFNLTIVNSTFAFNTARGGNAVVPAGVHETASPGVGNGGGLYLGIYHNTVDLINDTVAYNRSIAGNGPSGSLPPGAGGINADPGVNIWNTLVADNNAVSRGSARAFDVSGSFVSQGHNLIGTIDGASGFSTALRDLFGHRAAPLDPGLDTQLRANGGPTPTLALLFSSPAIDHGDNGVLLAGVSTDQRGVARPQGSAVDIGAFELVFPLVL